MTTRTARHTPLSLSLPVAILHTRSFRALIRGLTCRSMLSLNAVVSECYVVLHASLCPRGTPYPPLSYVVYVKRDNYAHVLFRIFCRSDLGRVVVLTRAKRGAFGASELGRSRRSELTPPLELLPQNRSLVDGAPDCGWRLVAGRDVIDRRPHLPGAAVVGMGSRADGDTAGDRRCCDTSARGVARRSRTLPVLGPE